MTTGSLCARDHKAKDETRKIKESAHAAVQAGKALEARQDFESARAMYLRAEQILRGSADGQLRHLPLTIAATVDRRLHEAGEAFDHRSYAQALQTIQEAKDLAESNPLIYYNMAVVFHAQDNDLSAIDALEQCLDLLRDGPQKENVAAVHAALIANRPVRPIPSSLHTKSEEFNYILAHPPLLSTQLADQQQRGCAIIDQLLTELAPTNVSPNATTATVLYDGSRCAEMRALYVQASTLLKRYIEQSPPPNDISLAVRRLATMEQLLDEPNSATPNERARYAAGEFAMSSGWPTNILNNFSDGVRIFPQDREIKWRLARFYESLGNAEEARVRLSEFTKSLDDDHRDDARAALGTIDTRRAIYDRYIADCKSLLVDVATNRSTSLGVRADRLNRIAQKLGEALLLFPYGWEANEMLAWIHLQTGNYHMATRSLDALWAQGRTLSFYAEVRHGDPRSKAYKRSGTIQACVELRQGMIGFMYYDLHCWPGDEGYLQPNNPLALPSSISITVVNKIVTSTSGPAVISLRNNPSLVYEILPSSVLIDSNAPRPLQRVQGNKAARLIQRYLRADNVTLGSESFTSKEWLWMGLEVSALGLAIYANSRETGKILQNLNTTYQMMRAVRHVLMSARDFTALVQYQRRISRMTSLRPIPLSEPKLTFKTSW